MCNAGSVSCASRLPCRFAGYNPESQRWTGSALIVCTERVSKQPSLTFKNGASAEEGNVKVVSPFPIPIMILNKRTAAITPRCHTSAN